VGGDNIGYTEK